ncbi:protein kinase [Pseudanabaena sp. FACHB-1998]|uniref:protein kinase domain-containing protein n=1 Tax=Pseudanabaena sp. FACHB-1998 TaxID=2692858 RepID=UPI00167FF7C3|nr:protein kinase [Pseudanabaena sp. FACHB-1998]MBD2175652.1 protein kinase [Pseudanabaena sp. FACHB-1998]
MNLEIGSLLSNRYEIIEELKSGGIGETFLAKDHLRFDEKCVVKQFVYTYFQDKKDLRNLFKEEARILLQLEKYSQTPNLLAYIDDQDCMVQELIQGQNLEDELQSNGKFSETQILDLLSEILPILDFVHKKGIIHKDIKPSNVMRQENSGKLLLLDFGISKRMDGSTAEQIVKNSNHKCDIQQPYSFPDGTKGYQSPDNYSSFSSDLYSLGATCLHLLTGMSPEDLQTLFDESWIESGKQYISDNTYSIIKNLLAIDPLERFQAAQDVLIELQNIDYIKRKNDIQVSLSLLSSPVDHFKPLAVNSLSKFGEDSQIAIPQLIELIKSQNEGNIEAWDTLVNIGAKAVIPIANLLKDERQLIRRKSAWALSEIGIDAIEVVSSIIELIRDSDNEICKSAIIAVGKIGLPARNAIPLILDILINMEYDLNCTFYLKTLDAIGYDINNIKIYYINEEVIRNGSEHIAFDLEQKNKASLELMRAIEAQSHTKTGESWCFGSGSIVPKIKIEIFD